MKEPQGSGAQVQFGDLRRFVQSRLTNLPGLLNRDARTARAEIARHIEKIELMPDGRIYIASGTWDLLGYDGAGGPAWTERLPVRFEWLAA